MSELGPLIRRMESIAQLSSVENAAVAGLPFRTAVLRPQDHAVRDGEHATQSCFLLSGFMLRYKITSAGGRQILAFHIPGDIPDLQSFQLGTMDHSLAAVVESRVAFVAHDDIQRLIETAPKLASILWRETLIDAAMFRAWIVAMGQLGATSRLAHLFCEMFTRMAAVGLTNGQSCDLPLTQPDLADALGISAVHVNRILQDLRRDRLIEFETGRLTILDWPGLQQLADFNPQYLQLREVPKVPAPS